MQFDFNYWRTKYLQNYSSPIEYFNGNKLQIEKSPTFEVISRTINQRGHIRPDEFVNICIWKTPRQKKRYGNKDNLKQIQLISKNIIQLHSNRTKDFISKSISLLNGLDGVQVSVASAFLTVLFPKQHCVIDYRVRRALFFLDNSENGTLSFNEYGYFSKSLDILISSPSIEVYLKYLENITNKSKIYKCTPRELEMSLWEFDANGGNTNGKE